MTYNVSNGTLSLYTTTTHIARRWVARERRSAWLVVDTQVKTCSRETHSPIQPSKSYGHNAFQVIHIYTPLLSTVVAHTLLNTAHTVALTG